MAKRDAEDIKKFVRDRYGSLAREKSSCCPPAPQASCCGPASATPPKKEWASALYSEAELKELPQEAAELSLGCGNPTAIAGLHEGEVALDLGSGGGIDCFLAAQKVGPRGRVIGLDMTPEMIQVARANAARAGLDNVEFRMGEMERMPLDDESVDVIISNCVINLSPDKDAVFREALRVLKPGGRLSVSDIVLLRELPPQVARSLEQWAGCVAGALSATDYRARLEAAGFAEVNLKRKSVSVPVPGFESLKGFIASMDITAHKPGR